MFVLSIQEDTSEVEALVDAAGLRVAEVVRQRRNRADPSTFLGRGKVRELRDRLPPHPPFSPGAPLVIVADELRPSVVFNLEEELGVRVWDRIRLILEVFERNAHVREAQLQVELARLRYDLPFVHEAIHRQLTGQRAGLMGAGEMEARTYETHLRRRTKKLTRDLDRVKRDRALRRKGRRRHGLRLLAIAGYTNSGKSSLLNTLTGSHTTTQQQVFSTLQTTTRRIRSTLHRGGSSDILLTDTVGFIQDLPPWLVDAFSSTLEEITHSDAVLLVVDASEDPALIEAKVTTAFSILDAIDAPQRQVILLNKADLLTRRQRDAVSQRLRSLLRPNTPFLFTSTTTGESIQDLVGLILADVLQARTARLILDRARPEHLRLESWLRDHTDVLLADDEDAHRILTVRCGLPAWGRLLHQAAQAHVRVQEASSGSKGGWGTSPHPDPTREG